MARYREIRRFDRDELPSTLQERAETITRIRSKTVTLVTIDGETWRCEELAAAHNEGDLDPGVNQQIRYFRSRGEWPCW